MLREAHGIALHCEWHEVRIEIVSKYILIGCGGFALEVAEYIQSEVRKFTPGKERNIITDVVSTSPSRLDDFYSILGYTPQFHELPDTVQARSDKDVLICLGNPRERHTNFIDLKRLDFNFGTFVHETAWVAKSAKIEEGVIICPFGFVGAKASIGANSVINTRTTVGHDVKIGTSTVLSPHSNMNGASKCGSVSFLGAGVIMDPGAMIGNYTKVSSGAVVKQKFGDGFLLTGSPAKGRQMFRVGSTVSG